MQKMIQKYLLALLCAIVAGGCSSEPEQSTASISADELLVALGGFAFEVDTPPGIDETKFGGLAIRYPDGRIQFFGGGNMIPSSAKLKVIVFDPKEGSLAYAIVGQGHSARGESKNFPAFKNFITSSKTNGIAVGEMLMRFSIDDSVTTPPLVDDDFDLIFHIQEH